MRNSWGKQELRKPIEREKSEKQLGKARVTNPTEREKMRSYWEIKNRKRQKGLERNIKRQKANGDLQT